MGLPHLDAPMRLSRTGGTDSACQEWGRAPRVLGQLRPVPCRWTEAPPSGQHSFEQMAQLQLSTQPDMSSEKSSRSVFPICPFNTGTDFRGRNIINPLPQRMVHHTSRDKEYTCLLKGKKRNVHFVLPLRNLIKLQGRVWHGYVHPRGGRGPHTAPLAPLLGCGHVGGSRPRALAGWGLSLLPRFLLLLEAEACASVQFSLFLSKIVSPGCACS